MRKFNHWTSTLALAVLLAALGTGCSAKVKADYHLHRAQEYFKDGQYANASIEYRKVLQEAPDNAQAWSHLGIIYCNQGRALEAAPILARAEQLDTNNLEVRLKLGTIYLGIGKLKEARQEAIFVLDRQPQNQQAPILLADASITTNDINDAHQRLQKLAQKGETAPLDVALGILAFHQRDVKAAETFFKLATARDPKFSDAYSELGNIYVLGKDIKRAGQAFKTAAQLAPVGSGKTVQYAQFKILTGDPAKGKELLQSLVKKQPDYLPGWIALAKLAAAQTNYEEGLTLLGNVLSRDPQNLEGMLLKARLDLMQGKTAQAVSDLEGAANVYPKAPTVLYQLAVAELANHNSAGAIKRLNQALNLDPKLAQATLLLARIQIQMGNAGSAIASLNQLIGQQPRLAQARLLLAAAYRAQGSPADAVQIYRQLAKAYPKDPEIPLLLGQTYIQQNQTADAHAQFEKALQLAPDSLLALEQLVNLEVHEKQYRAAQDRVQQEADKHPKSAPLQLLLGQVLAAQGQTNQAEAAMSKAIQMQPDYQAAYLLLAQVYAASGQNGKALNQLQTLLAKNPRSASALMLKAMIYNSDKNYTGARDAYENLLTVNSNNAVALNNLACVYADHLNQLDKASQLARQARNIAPTDPAIADTLGWILYRQGQYAAALNYLQQSAAKLYALPEAQYHLAMAYYMMANEADARTAFERALHLNQNFPEKTQCRQYLGILNINPKTSGAKTRQWLENWTTQHPGDPIALERLAAIYDREGMTDKAISTYQAAAKANPQSVPIMEDLARLYAPSDLQKAITWANAAYKQAANNPTVTHLLGRLEFQAGDYKWALTLLQLTAQAQPQNPTALYDLGQAYYSMGRVPEARTSMQNALQNGLASDQVNQAKRFLAMTALADHPAQALAAQPQVQAILKSNPDYVPALMAQALIATQKSDLSAAERTCQEVLRRYPDFAPAQKLLAILYAKNPANDAKAYALAVKAQSALPNDPQLAEVLGILVYRRGDYTHAVSLLQQSARQERQDPELFYYLGMAQYRLNHRAQSKTALQKALALNLSGAQAANARKTLAALK